ncbi:MAG: aminomethyl transferase family protein [Clostridiales bacterium]|jgi:glycine cleavage system aminomethyltransferase T|nr:aminomethyl transferase family protein [Eubacteriales bacterium]MDH7566969.1 aminomethyl transferase family protein [Clostridiales bacterium]
MKEESLFKPSTLELTPTVPVGDDSFMGIVSPYEPVIPFEYTGWRDEVNAWVDGSYLGTSISISFTYSVKGPEARDFFKKYFVNDFDNFPVGKAKHGIMCYENGKIMSDGVILRIAEDEYYTVWLWPYIQYALETSKFDAVGTLLTGQVYLFQVAGPTSLQILEKATGENLHDIQFLHHRMSKIAGHDVRILRLGMAGTLAYEVHGKMEDAHDVYNAIWEAGKGEYKMKKLGYQAYMLNHTEDGYPQATYHFDYAYHDDKDFIAWLKKDPMLAFYTAKPTLLGSIGNDHESFYRNPIELGWGGMINFNHDFVGKEALAEMKKNPKRQMVTLEWNAEDIGDVFASQFRDDVPYKNMDKPNDYYNFDLSSGFTYHADKVLVNGKFVGISSGRARCEHYHRMISLCSIDTEYAKIGQEVTVVWGEPGTRQKEIRATVARFPYLQAELNKHVDVSKIPQGNK